jgi:hypothetical protein
MNDWKFNDIGPAGQEKSPEPASVALKKKRDWSPANEGTSPP